MNKIIIKNNLDAIANVDFDIAAGIRSFGYPQPRIRTTGFETFLSNIVSQQLSTTVIGRKYCWIFEEIEPLS